MFYPKKVVLKMFRLNGAGRWNKRCCLNPNRYSVILPLLLFIAITFSSGCGDRPVSGEVSLDVTACAGRLREAIAFQDTLTLLNDQMIATIYRIPAGDVVAQQVYASTGATAEEIAVFEAVSAEAAQRIETAVWQRVAEQKVSFEDYLPAELPKLADPFVLVKDRYVILCVSDCNEEVKTELERLLNNTA